MVHFYQDAVPIRKIRIRTNKDLLVIMRQQQQQQIITDLRDLFERKKKEGRVAAGRLLADINRLVEHHRCRST